MSDNEKKVVIVIALVAAILLFYFWYSGSSTTTSTTLATPSPSPSSPDSVSLPDPVSLASSISTQTGEDITPPVAVSGTAASFVAGVTSPETQNAGQAAPSTTLPAGFQTWYNSLGPINQAHMAAEIPTMPAADIAFINNVVTQNLWGQASIAAQWNAFVAKYGLPMSGSFSSFSGPTLKNKRK